MDTFETIFGLLCLLSFVVAIYFVIVSRRQATAAMEQGWDKANVQRAVSNAEAIEVAKSYFESYDGKAYRKYAKRVISDAELPLQVEPQTTRRILGGLFITGLMVVGLVGGMGAEGVIFNAIPIPGPLFQVLILGVALLGVWMAGRAWVNRHAQLHFGHDSMTLYLDEHSIELDYGSYQLLVTPSHKNFILEFMPKSDQLNSLQKILDLFPNKTVAPILVVKAIEFDTLHSAVGLD